MKAGEGLCPLVEGARVSLLNNSVDGGPVGNADKAPISSSGESISDSDIHSCNWKFLLSKESTIAVKLWDLANGLEVVGLEGDDVYVPLLQNMEDRDRLAISGSGGRPGHS